jgi:predicted N-acetyltransferase YhbS
MEVDMEYNVLKVTDIEKVIPLYIEYYNEQEDSEWTEGTVYKRIHQVVTREDSYGLILSDGNSIVGFAMGYFEQYDDGKAYDLVEIVISHKYQRKGIGTSFMQELEKRVKELGAFLIQMQSVNDEKHNNFYGNLGYNDCKNLILKSKVI